MTCTWDWPVGDPWHMVPGSFILEKMLPQDELRTDQEPHRSFISKFKGVCSSPWGQR